MPRRPALFTQADLNRAIRAATQAGASVVEVRPDKIVVLLNAPEISPWEFDGGLGKSERHHVVL